MTNKILTAGSVALMGAGSLLGTTSTANAFTVEDCGAVPDGAFVSLLDGDVCSVLFNYNSDTDWTVPSGIDRLAAVLVGGGGGSVSLGVGYAGGGGEVIYVSDVDPADAVDIAVGEGGTFANGGDGEQSSFGPYTALGGEHGDWSLSGDLGDSGSGNTGFAAAGDIFLGLYGGGAKTAATSAANGDGYLLSDPDLTENDELFPAIDGALPWGQGGSIGASMPETTGYGEGASATSSASAEGTQGAIVFRWIAVEPTDESPLASTGVEANAIGMTAGALGLGGVALAVVAAARRARRSK